MDLKTIKLKKEKTVFIPGCVTDDNGMVVCSPRLVKGGVTLESQHPIRMKRIEVEGKPMMEILDDGGAQAELIDELRRFVAKRHL